MSSACSRSTAGTTSSTSSPGRSACSSPATPPAHTRSGSAPSTSSSPSWASSTSAAATPTRSSSSSRSTPRTTSSTWSSGCSASAPALTPRRPASPTATEDGSGRRRSRASRDRRQAEGAPRSEACSGRGAGGRPAGESRSRPEARIRRRAAARDDASRAAESAGRDPAGRHGHHRPDPVARVAQGVELRLVELVDPVRELSRRPRSVTAENVSSSRPESFSGGSIGRSASASSCSTSRPPLPQLRFRERAVAGGSSLGHARPPCLHLLLQLLDRAMDQHLGRAVGAAQRAGDLAVVHAEREAHDQRLAAVIGKVVEILHHRSQLLAPLDDRLGAVPGGDRVGVLQRRLRSARAVAVVVRGEVVRDADQPGPQRAPVGLAARALEVAVGLQEGLLGEVLGVVVVAHPVVRVGVDVAQMRPVEVLERPVELRLGGRIGSRRLDGLGPLVLTRPDISRRSRRMACALRPAQSGNPRLGAELALDQRREPLRPSASIPARGRPSPRSAGPSRAPPTPARSRPGSASAGTPSPSSSPARRLRLSGASTVAVRSPTPASPVKVSSSRPARDRVVDALAPDLRGGDPRRVEAVRLGRRGGERRCVLGGAGHLDADDVARSARRPGRRGRRPRRAGRAGRRRRSRARAPPSPRPPPARGPARRGRRRRGREPAPRRTREGSWPCGATRPLLSISMAERSPIRSAIEPTACGSDLEGTARQIRSRPASSISEACLTSSASGRPTPSQIALVLPGAAPSPPPGRRCGCRAGPRARRGRAGPPPPFPSCRRRSRRRGASAAGRRGPPTEARCWARSAR